MKTKIIGIFVSMLLIASTTTILVSSSNIRMLSVIDQQQLNTSQQYFLENGKIHWQQFMNFGKTIEEVQVHIGHYFMGSKPMTLSIQGPIGTTLCSKTLTTADIPDHVLDWCVFDVPDTPLKPKGIYYIVIEFDLGSEYEWSGAHGDPYPKGMSSHPDPDWDFAFKTIVDKTKTSESEATLQDLTPGNTVSTNYLSTREILYHSDYGSGIWRIREDGTGNVQVSDHGWFATHYGLNGIIFGQYYNSGIHIMNSGGVNEKILSATEGDCPHGSPDQQKIVYHIGGTDPTERRVWIMDIDGSNAHMLTSNPGHFAEFSPDGQWIAYEGAVGADIWLIKPDGTGEMKLVEGGRMPTWSPDGDWIAFQNIPDGLIWKIRTDGTGKQQLSEFKGIHPDWDSTGEFIAYEYYEISPPTGIRAVKYDSTNDHEISSTGHAPRWFYKYNNPPSIPSVKGETNGNINTAYDYVLNSNDPEGDEILYYVDWGDGSNSNWVGPYPSGQAAHITHTYTAEDVYTIQAMTQDASLEYESDWGTLTVTMPYVYNPLQQLFEWLFERFPHAFPLLRQLMGY